MEYMESSNPHFYESYMDQHHNNDRVSVESVADFKVLTSPEKSPAIISKWKKKSFVKKNKKDKKTKKNEKKEKKEEKKKGEKKSLKMVIRPPTSTTTNSPKAQQPLKPQPTSTTTTTIVAPVQQSQEVKVYHWKHNENICLMNVYDKHQDKMNGNSRYKKKDVWKLN